MNIGDTLILETFDYGFAEKVEIIDKTEHGYKAKMYWNDGQEATRFFGLRENWFNAYRLDPGPKSILIKALSDEV